MIIISKNFYQKNNIYYKLIKNADLELIQNFYEENPFPGFEIMEDIQSIKKKGENNFIIRQVKNKFKFNNKILELGSGTCNMSIYLAAETNNKVFALDGNLSSLQLADKLIQNNKIKNLKLFHADLFDDNFLKSSFDLVWCSGVLHHTQDPKKGFFKIQEYVKKDGYIVVGLYNKYFRVNNYIKKFLYKIFGEKILYNLDPILKKKKLSEKQQKAWIRDQYEHPLESVHTYGEVIKWFDEKNIEIINFYPNFDSCSEFNIFKKSKNDIRNSFNRSILQLSKFFNSHSSDGGLFLMVGKKNE